MAPAPGGTPIPHRRGIGWPGEFSRGPGTPSPSTPPPSRPRASRAPRLAASAGNAQSDLAWTPSTAAIATLAGTPIPVGAKANLMLTASDGPGSVRVVTVGADGTTSVRTVDIAADSATVLDVSGASAVWVRHGTGTVRAAASLEIDDRDGPLYSVVALNAAAMTTTDVPVREIRR